MSNISSADYQVLLARERARLGGGMAAKSSSAALPVDREEKLHNDIINECRRRGWVYFHSRMDRATGRTLGEPDFTIVNERGVFFIECKAAGGKLTSAQAAMGAWLAKFGHSMFIVRNVEEFLEVVNQ
jgi:hypothetical protein